MAFSPLMRQLPGPLRGAELLHPWVFPWFAAGAFVIGVPATVQRPAGLWVSVAVGVSFLIGCMFLQWLVLSRRTYRTSHNVVALVSLMFASAVAGILTQIFVPVESYVSTLSNSPSTTMTAPDVEMPASTRIFLALCLIIVWMLLWVLMALLVSGHRTYRKELRALRAVQIKTHYVAKRLTTNITTPIQTVITQLVAELRSQARLISEAKNQKSKKTKEQLLVSLAKTRDQAAAPALGAITSIQLTELASEVPLGRVRRLSRVRLAGIPFRWNGRFFSGGVGALTIGVVALSASASVEFTSPGFLIQIPMIVLAFFVSVSASLILFLAAALTPFLGPSSAAAENYVLFVVIGILALLSFLHRANEVRQTRILEGLSVANTDLALETVQAAQQATNLQKRMVSIIHGRLQSSLVAAIVKLEKATAASREDARSIETVFTKAADELESALHAEKQFQSTDFATAIADVVEMWGGTIDIHISITGEAETILSADRNAAATAIEVISEGTLNAAKHAPTTRVEANISSEGNRLRVSVTNSREGKPNEMISSTNVGLAFLSQLTTDLRLVSNEHSTTLFAEIPSRVLAT